MQAGTASDTLKKPLLPTDPLPVGDAQFRQTELKNQIISLKIKKKKTKAWKQIAKNIFTVCKPHVRISFGKGKKSNSKTKGEKHDTKIKTKQACS